MKTRSKGFKTTALSGAIAMCFAILAATTYFSGVPVGAALAPSILAPTVSASINIQAPGTEAFWKQLTPLQIPLTSTTDYGGATKSVSLKVANNGTHVLMAATWADPSQSNRSITTGAPAAGAAYEGLFFANGTIHRADRFGVWWSLSQNPGPPPCMQDSAPGKGGAASITGKGNVWQWVTSSTDSQGFTYGTGKFGAGTPNAGKNMTYAHSFARDMFLNQTGFFDLGYTTSNKNATVGVDTATQTSYNTFLVYAKGIYNNTAHTWTLVMSRPLTTPGTPTNIQQFNQGASYYFALAAFDGGAHPIPAGVPAPAGWTQMADNGMTKSISTWYTMALSPLSPSQLTTTSSSATSSASTVTQSGPTVTQSASTVTTTITATGESTISVGFETAALSAFVMLIVGFIVGVVVIARVARPK
jgi:hypothetical protein